MAWPLPASAAATVCAISSCPSRSSPPMADTTAARAAGRSRLPAPQASRGRRLGARTLVPPAPPGRGRAAACRPPRDRRRSPRPGGAPGTPGRRGCRARAGRPRPVARAGRASIASSSSSNPRPDRADTTTAWGSRRSRAATVSGSAMSALLMTMSSRTWPASISAEHLAHCGDLLLGGVVRPVDHVQDQVGVDDLLERRSERLDQLVRQVAHEADGVGERVLAAAGRPRPADGRVERGEQRVLDEDAGVGDAVEQARLAGVRVAGDGHGRACPRGAGPRAAWCATSPSP